MENDGNGAVVRKKEKVKGKHDKPKPWDDDPNIDRWKIDKFDPTWNEGGMLDVTSFSTLFPRYREKYLQDAWPSVKAALKEYDLTGELNMVEGSMTVSTTRKTRDPYIVVKARDLIKLLSRSVPAPQALKVLNDDMQCDIIKINNLVRNKEKFIKRRERLIGPNSSTLKALEILTGCYILVQGNTVASMGSFKGLKMIRKIVEDCIENKMHPVFHIKILMVRKELEKDPTLAEENWDRFLPKFKKKNVNQPKPKESRTKKTDAILPPPQQPRKEDKQLETGEYFMSDEVKQAKNWKQKQETQLEKVAENKRKRESAFVPPKEPAMQDNKSDEGNKDITALATSLKKKAKEYGTQKLIDNVNPEAYLADSAEPSKKKSQRT